MQSIAHSSNRAACRLVLRCDSCVLKFCNVGACCCEPSATRNTPAAAPGGSLSQWSRLPCWAGTSRAHHVLEVNEQVVHAAQCCSPKPCPVTPVQPSPLESVYAALLVSMASSRRFARMPGLVWAWIAAKTPSFQDGQQNWEYNMYNDPANPWPNTLCAEVGLLLADTHRQLLFKMVHVA